jgi:hypothetical protein
MPELYLLPVVELAYRLDQLQLIPEWNDNRHF